MAKMMAPNETIWWIPESVVAFNPDAPSAALLTEEYNISCAIVSGHTLNSTDSDTDGTTTICMGSNSETPTFYNYEGNLTLVREAEGAGHDATSPEARSYEFFKYPDAAGYLVQRFGYKNNVAAAAGQEVSVFKFSSDNPQDVVPDDGGTIQLTVPFLPQGKMVLDVALVA